MKKIKRWFSLFMLQTICFVNAADMLPYRFVVWTYDGEQVAYNISENPIIIHDRTNIVVRTTRNKVEYFAEDVWKFTLTKDDSGVENMKIKYPTMSFDGNVIILAACNAFSTVKIYDINGSCVENTKTDIEGYLQLDISNYPHGVYIITTEILTYKIVK